MADEGEFYEPTTTVEKAANLGLNTVTDALEKDGIRLRYMLVLVSAENAPDGETDCATAGAGFDDARDMIATVYSHFANAMEKLGVEVKLEYRDE